MTSAVGREQDQPERPASGGPAVSGRRGGASIAVAGAAYLALLLFGLAQGVLGSFFYGSGPVPLAAVGFDLLIFVTCVLGGWGMRSAAGALAPAAGWLVSTFVLALGTPAGSVIVTAGSAGQWFLFGGAAAAAAGAVVTFVARTRAAVKAAVDSADKNSADKNGAAVDGAAVDGTAVDGTGAGPRRGIG